MSEKAGLPVAGGVGRRQLLQGLVAGVGAGLTLPGGVDAAEAAPALDAAVAKAKTPAAKPVFLDAHQFATLTALCARILPGSEKAVTDRFIDEVLAVAGAERQKQFLAALGAIEGEAITRFQKPFRALTEAQQVAVLEEASAGKPGREEWVWTPGTVLREPDPGPDVVTLRDRFDHLKGWIVNAYYSSEAGLRELGYTGQMFFATFPDCTHGDHTP
jgi:hypothetical protein